MKVTVEMIPRLNPWQLVRLRQRIEEEAKVYDIDPLTMPEPHGTIAADMYWEAVRWYDDFMPSSHEYLEQHPFYRELTREIWKRKAMGTFAIPLRKT